MFMYGPKDNKTIRVRTFLDIPDRIVFQAIGNIIIENCYADIDRQADKTIFAHIPAPKNCNGTLNDFTFRKTFSNEHGKGQYENFLDTVFRDFQEAAVSPSYWMMETDITAFYPSLDHKMIEKC